MIRSEWQSDFIEEHLEELTWLAIEFLLFFFDSGPKTLPKKLFFFDSGSRPPTEKVAFVACRFGF